MVLDKRVYAPLAMISSAFLLDKRVYAFLAMTRSIVPLDTQDYARSCIRNAASRFVSSYFSYRIWRLEGSN